MFIITGSQRNMGETQSTDGAYTLTSVEGAFDQVVQG
jgi:hypothetical protein